jgi:tRNA G10  N-methylase Trm11
MKILIQTGHNPELAIFEFQRLMGLLITEEVMSGIEILPLNNKQEFFIVDFAEKLDENPPQPDFWQHLIDHLGGTVRIFEVMTFEDENSLINFFDSATLALGNKFNYSIISERQNVLVGLQNIFKKFAKKNKLKVINKISPENNLLSPSRYWSAGLDDGLEIYYVSGDIKTQDLVIAKTLAVTNPKQDIDFDKNRPSTKITHSSSYRLARILINIITPEKIKRLIDPFCGTGTLLIAALNRGFQVYGIDNDPELIKIANENINWGVENYHFGEDDVQIVLADSLSHKITGFSPQGVIFEPYMGEFLTELPTYGKLQQTTKKLHKFYARLFANLASQLEPPGVVSCILPDFEAKSGKIIEIPHSVFTDHGWYLAHSKLPYSAVDGSRLKRHVYFLKRSR